MAKRFKQSLGEYDLNRMGYVQVYIPTAKGFHTRVWVRVLKGDHRKGQGIIDDEPRVPCRSSNRPLKLGTVITFSGGTEVIRPKFVRVMHEANKKPELIKEVTERLMDSMTFNPSSRTR